MRQIHGSIPHRNAPQRLINESFQPKTILRPLQPQERLEFPVCYGFFGAPAKKTAAQKGAF